MAGCEYMGGTRGSSFVTTADVLEMSAVCEVKGVCGSERDKKDGVSV